MKNINSYNCEQNLVIDDVNYKFFDLKIAAKAYNLDLDKIPISLKVILENLIRNEDNETVDKVMIESVFNSLSTTNKKNAKVTEIAFFPTKFLMQDFTGVPAVADLAAMRNALKNKGIEPKKSTLYLE